MRRSVQALTATYRIVTPMFIGDAGQQATAINPGSVKGALRFWWRALNWGRIRCDEPDADDAAALQRLHREEGALFGSAAENGPGQACFLLQVIARNVGNESLKRSGCGIQYLAGQGLYRNGFLRSAIAPGEFDLICRLRPGASELARNQLLETLLAFGTLGGLGSRARKGFGSVAIQSLRLNDAEQDIPVDKASILARIGVWKQTTDLPPFTAFSLRARVDISLQGGEPLDLLEAAGRELQLYRSWGQRGKVCGKDREGNFESDHNLMEGVARGERPSRIPERSVFGIPHNYHFSSIGANVELNLSAKDRSRRASPLFIHVHQFPDGKAVLLQLLFPARFLSPGDELEFKPGRGGAKRLAFAESMIEWDKIHKYMDRFSDRERAL